MGAEGVCCDANNPPAKAACMGSFEVASIPNIGSDVSSSPKPSMATPKAAPKGSPPPVASAIGDDFIEVLAVLAGREVASILRSFVKGPSSTEPEPESVL